MSSLSDKILTYSPEVYYRFNQAYTTAPTNAGSAGSTTFTLSNEAPTYVSSEGPNEEDSWRFGLGRGISDTTPTQFQSAQASSYTNTNLPLTDRDFSGGVWFKTNFTLDNALAHPTSVQLFNFGGTSTTRQFVAAIAGNTAENSIKGKLQITSTGASAVNSTIRIDDQEWHYFAFRATPNGSNVTYTYYLDGTSIGTQNPSATTSANTFTTFGINTLSSAFAGSSQYTYVEFSNYYVTPFATIDATAISEIWTIGSVGPATNVTITETPATATALQVLPTVSINSNNVETPAIASALMTEPTIAVTSGNHTEITTSILVSAEFPSSIAVSAQSNVNNVITDILTASVEIINNVEVDTGMDTSFSAQEMTASAEFVEPILATRPMTANATMPEGTASVTPNYYSLVKSKDPVVYIPVGNEFPSWATETKSYGSWTPVSMSRSGTLTADSLAPMNLVGLGESSDFRNNQTNPRITGTFNQTDIDNLISSRNYTIEYWTYLTGTFKVIEDLIAKFNMKNLEIDYLGWIYTGVWVERKTLTLKFGNNAAISCPAANILQRNAWNHIVLKVTPETNPSQQTYYLYANGSLIASGIATVSFATDANNVITWERNIEGSLPNTEAVQPKIDEMAIYNYPLSNSQILANYNFINSLSPNKTIAAEPFEAILESVDHNFLVISNVNYPETPVTSSAILVDPTTIASQVINVSAEALTASATNTDATVYWGWTIYETPATAYAEKAPAYFLNDLYYQYVQTNIAPYRYVSFDAMDEYLDYGTDNDYSVVPTVVGGTIVNPDLGINGKSAKTAGTSYVTDGVILKESEWNDSWGTGQNSYHSAFWFQRAVDDASNTGLRVLWNLNGYKDNQHAVLYQYQNKLHLQFNNGSGTWIEQDSGTLDLFDYQRHFVVINFNHTNPVNNIVTVYVDAVLRMTIDLGAYTGSTTNASSADSGPNNEANNHPRLSVGSLITPFAATALPVVPTNTKLIIDEIYWDKNAINQTMVTNLYATMPDKNNKIIIATPLTAIDEFVMPAFSTSSVLAADTITASVESVEPTISVVRQVVRVASPMTATALSVEGTVFEDRIISADIFVATVTFNNAGVIITIPGGPITASAQLVKPSLVNNEPITDLTAYVRYLRAQNYNGNVIPRLVEIK